MQEDARIEDVYRFFEGFIMMSHPVTEAKDVRGLPFCLACCNSSAWSFTKHYEWSGHGIAMRAH